MSSERPAIQVKSLSKRYEIYDSPSDRLKQFVLPRLAMWLGVRTPPCYYEAFWALEGISCDIPRGETVGIIGRNGSGKSTLLQILCGTLAPTGGSVTVNGRVAALLELGAGFNMDYTGRENVYLNCSILGLSREEIDMRFDQIAAFADIGNFIEQPVKLYSSGMFARLAFAAAIHVDAEILIVDEALSVGDFAFQFKCLRRLQQIATAGCTVLFVTHDVNQVQRLCTRVLYLKAGRTVFFGDAREGCNRYLADERGASASAVGRQSTQAAELPAVQALIAQTNSHAQFASRVAAHRRGTREAAEILLVSVNGMTEGDPQVAFGAQVNVAIDFRLLKNVARPTIAIYAIDSGGQLIVGTNSQYEGLDLASCPLRATHRLEFTFENRLCSGRFGIQVLLVDFKPGAETCFLDYIDLAMSFVSLPETNAQRWAWVSPEFRTRLIPLVNSST